MNLPHHQVRGFFKPGVFGGVDVLLERRKGGCGVRLVCADIGCIPLHESCWEGMDNRLKGSFQARDLRVER